MIPSDIARRMEILADRIINKVLHAEGTQPLVPMCRQNLSPPRSYLTFVDQVYPILTAFVGPLHYTVFLKANSELRLWLGMLRLVIRRQFVTRRVMLQLKRLPRMIRV